MLIVDREMKGEALMDISFGVTLSFDFSDVIEAYRNRNKKEIKVGFQSNESIS